MEQLLASVKELEKKAEENSQFLNEILKLLQRDE